jgi:chitinase
MAFTADSRSRFARSCALFVHQYGFNGIDIDWEYPGGGGANPARGRAEDRRNYTLLLAELRRQLTEQGRADQKQYLLTIATPASPKNCRCIELDKVHELVDFINLMTYDFTGSWSPVTGLNAPLFGPPPSTTSHTAPTDRPALSVDLAVRNYLAAGVPAQKLVLGVPFYGKAFGGVSDVNHGLFQPHGRQPAGPSGGGDWSYRNIKKQYLLTANPAIRFWDNLAKVPWIYDARSGVMVSYDDPISLRLKAQYAHEHKLGGVMIWELSQDDDQSSLLTALNTSP